MNASQLNARMGTLFFLLGAVMSVLIFVDRWTSIDIRFPSVWYTSRNFHLMTCIAMFVLGYRAHRLATVADEAQTGDGPVFESVRVYTREGCELCDKAIRILEQFQDNLPPPECVDIEHDPALMEQHSEWIPVVEIDGQIRFRGTVSEELLERLIDARKLQRQTERRRAGHDVEKGG